VKQLGRHLCGRVFSAACVRGARQL
jgi:hypothetical protein